MAGNVLLIGKFGASAQTAASADSARNISWYGLGSPKILSGDTETPRVSSRTSSMQLRLSFMNSTETSISAVRGRGKIDIEKCLEAAGPAREDRQARAEVNGFIDVVSHEKDGHSVFAPHLQQKLLHHQARLSIKRAERFIHQHHARLVDEHAREADTLLHAAGELRRIMPRKF